MVDVIIIALVAVLLCFAIKGTVKHFKGEGPCCGGGSELLDKEDRPKVLDGPLIGEKTLKVSGMHCEHCVSKVRKALNSVDGVSAEVYLKDNTAKVSYTKDIDDAVLKNVVKAAGYEVVKISEVA